MQQVVKKVVLHPEQFRAFNFDTQYAAVIAGVQSGKTFLGAFWAAKQIEENKGNGLIGAPTYKHLQQSTLDKFFREFPSYRTFYKEQKGQIEFPDGRKIFIRSFDNPFSSEGMTIDWAWLDEAGLMPYHAIIVVRSRLSTTQGKCLITTTPYNMGWLYRDFYLPWKEKRDVDLSVFTWPSIANPYFPPDFFQKEKVRLREEEFNRRYMGQFTRMEGLVYALREWHLVDQVEAAADITIGGIDWGFNNPAALMVLKLIDGVFYIVDEWYETLKTTPQIIEAAMHLQNKWGVNRWYADSANPEKIEEANRGTGLYVMGYPKLKNSVSYGTSKIQQMMMEKQIKVAKECKHTIDEFESYHYEVTDSSSKPEEPVAEFNHLMDAMRYAIMGYSPAKRFAPSQKRKAERDLLREFDAHRKVSKEAYFTGSRYLAR